MPSDRLAGRFAPAEQLPGGYYRQTNDSGVLYPGLPIHDPETGLPVPGIRRDSSTDSFLSSTSSVHTPRRVESIFDPADTSEYFAQQALQRPPGGASYESRQRNTNAPPISLENHRRERRPRSMSAGRDRVRAIISAADRPHGEHGLHRRSVSIDTLRSIGTNSTVSLHFDVPLPHRTRALDGVSRGKSLPKYDVSPATESHMEPLPRERRNSAPEINAAEAMIINTTSRGRPQSHNGRSPLARKSFVRLASDGVPTSASVHGAEARISRRLSSDDEGPSRRRGRRRTPTAYGSDGRRRLSKRSRAPCSRDSSQG